LIHLKFSPKLIDDVISQNAAVFKKKKLKIIPEKLVRYWKFQINSCSGSKVITRL